MKTQQLLDILKFLFWVIFIGLLIKTGAMLFTFGMGFFNPEGTHNLYLGLDLYGLREANKWEFLKVGSLLIGVVASQAYIAFLVIKIISQGNMKQPFTATISALISNISYYALGLGIVSLIAQGYCEWLIKKGMEIPLTWAPKEFLFLAAVIFIISKVFQRGVEIQTENELTV